MPRAFAWILAAVTVAVLALFGLAIGIALTTQDRPSGSIDTDLEGVTVSPQTTTEPEPEPPPEPVGDRRCWDEFGADPNRSLARAQAVLGLPARKFVWTRGLDESPRLYSAGGGLRGMVANRVSFDATVAVPLKDAGLLDRRGDVRFLLTLTTRLLPWRTN